MVNLNLFYLIKRLLERPGSKTAFGRVDPAVQQLIFKAGRFLTWLKLLQDLT